MKPAPPVMQMRLPLKAMWVLSVMVLTKRKQFVLGNTELEERRHLRARPFERRDDHQVEGHLLVLGDRSDGDAEEFVAVGLVENGDRFESRFAQRQIRQFRRLAPAVNGDALVGRRALRERRAQVLPDLAVEM